MIPDNLYCAGTTPAIIYARQFLADSGIHIHQQPSLETKHLLLDVPSFRPGSGESALHTLLASLPRSVTVWGGNLNCPALEEYRCMDLLQDESYLWENAGITARCAVQLAGSILTHSPAGCTAIIVGWGRIGKQLAFLLREQGCTVTVSSRNHAEAAEAAGFHTVSLSDLPGLLARTSLLYNTAPAPVLSEAHGRLCPDCLKIDLASVRGIQGADVIPARGLPGTMAPEQSGRLIAGTVLRLWKEERK